MSKPTKENGRKRGRRRFLKSVALGAGTLALAPSSECGGQGAPRQAGIPVESQPSRTAIDFPRTFSGRQLKMVAFSPGGVGCGSIGLGGRGQLRDWEIFNRPDKGNPPQYAFPSIRVQRGNREPVARVLEARLTPPYQGESGLGFANVPGLPRLESCKFTGEFPLARIDFEDSELPAKVSLEAFTPFIPLEADDSGLPVAVLRYRVSDLEATPPRTPPSAPARFRT